MKRFITAILFTVSGLIVQSQIINLDFIFSPGMTMGAEFAFPSGGANEFSYLKNKIQVVVPLKTKIKFEIDKEAIKKLNFKTSDVKGHQDFLVFNATGRTPKTQSVPTGTPVYLGSLGYTGVSASLQNGIWIYSANLSVSESTESFKKRTMINGLAYALRVKLNDLKLIYFYGAAIAYNQGVIIPVPMFGFTTKVAKKLRFTLILPVQADLTLKLSKKTK